MASVAILVQVAVMSSSSSDAVDLVALLGDDRQLPLRRLRLQGQQPPSSEQLQQQRLLRQQQQRQLQQLRLLRQLQQLQQQLQQQRAAVGGA